MTVDLWYTSVISYLAKRPARDLIVDAHPELTLAALLEMEVNPIIEEVRRIRQEYAKRFGYDLCAVAADVRRREQQHPGRLVSFPPRPVREKRTVLTLFPWASAAMLYQM